MGRFVKGHRAPLRRAFASRLNEGGIVLVVQLLGSTRGKLDEHVHLLADEDRVGVGGDFVEDL